MGNKNITERSNNYYKGISEYEQYEDNPFVEKAISEVNPVRKMIMASPSDPNAKKAIVNYETGDVEGHTAFMKYIEVDEEKFAKIYLSQFSHFWDLSKPALRVFGYIFSNIQPHQDRFIFRLDKCLAYTGYKGKHSVFTGLADLIKNGIVARSKYADEYFINPLIAFNGSRVSFTKTYVKKKRAKKQKEDENQMDLFKTEAKKIEATNEK